MITVTPAAAERLKALCREGGLQIPRLRLGTVAGSCSGHQYDMRLESTVAEGGIVVQAGGVEVVVAPDSYPLLEGSEVDYVETLMEAGFVLRNPNAISQCTCGRSFQTAGDGGNVH